MSERAINNLRAAVETMMGACLVAEQSIKNGTQREAEAVIHQLAWGFANASSSIQCAMNAIDEAHEIAIYELTEKLKAAEVKP